MYPPLPLVVGPEVCYVGDDASCACQLVDAGRCIAPAVAVTDITEKRDTIKHVDVPQTRQPQMPHPELVIVEK